MINQAKSGLLAEQIVEIYLDKREKRTNVRRSNDKYDTQKDISYREDDKWISVEVKYQKLYGSFISYAGKRQSGFSIGIFSKEGIYHNQLSKCLNVDRLIFVTAENDRVKIYEAPPLGKRKFEISLNKRDKRLLAFFNISTMKLLEEINEPNLCRKLKQGS